MKKSTLVSVVLGSVCSVAGVASATDCQDGERCLTPPGHTLTCRSNIGISFELNGQTGVLSNAEGLTSQFQCKPAIRPMDAMGPRVYLTCAELNNENGDLELEISRDQQDRSTVFVYQELIEGSRNHVASLFCD